jgi:hypothetical protein
MFSSSKKTVSGGKTGSVVINLATPHEIEVELCKTSNACKVIVALAVHPKTDVLMGRSTCQCGMREPSFISYFAADEAPHDAKACEVATTRAVASCNTTCAILGKGVVRNTPITGECARAETWYCHATCGSGPDAPTGVGSGATKADACLAAKANAPVTTGTRDFCDCDWCEH